MKFKIGDQVQIIDIGSTFFTCFGEIVGSATSGPRGAGTAHYDVSMPSFGLRLFEETQLSYNNDPLWRVNRSVDPINLSNKESETTKCDCGGFKTFGSMSEENHSSWCSSRQKIGAGFGIKTQPLTFEMIKSAILKSLGDN